MTLSITKRAEQEANKHRVQPQLVLEIDGVTTLFGAVEISRLIRVGDPGLVIGNSWQIGGVAPVPDQAQVISVEGGGGTRIDQQLRPDQGSVSSVSSVQLHLIDKNLIMTRLISPGVVVDDVLGRKATLWMGFKNTAFKEDYIPIISGIIDEVEAGAGNVKLNIAHPEQKKRQDIFTPVNFVFSAPLDATSTTLGVLDATNIPVPQAGPDGSFDTAIRFYAQVEDEIIRYTGISGNNLTGCVRGDLGTLAATHAANDDGEVLGKTLVQIEDQAVFCALKIMLSGLNGPFKTDVPITRYLHPTPITTLANSIYFDGIDLNRDFGVAIGDFITIIDSVITGNNCTAKQITAIEVVDGGSYCVVAGVSFVEDPGTTAICSFRSQFDTLGYGLAMTPDQVDVNEHVFWNNFQLASFTYRFVIKDTISGKDFLDKEVYLPIGAYSLPRQGRCSMGYHVGPVIRDKLKVLGRDEIKNPDKIRLKRTINRNFYNTIVYKYDEQVLTGKFASGRIAFSGASQSRIPVGSKAFVIESKGMRRFFNGDNIADRISTRYLNRYKFAAEYFETINVMFKDGFNIEPGDVVMLDPTGLKISNTEAGDRNKRAKVFTVTNKSLDLKTGDVTISLTDTNFDETERYGSVSPSSLVVSGTTTSILIQDSFGAIFPGDEGKKWEDYAGLPIIVHSEDWTREERVTLLGVDPSNGYQLLIDPSTPLASPPTAGMIIDIDNYPDTTAPADDARYKAAHAFAGKAVAILSGTSNTQFTVATGDAIYFPVGTQMRVHNPAYTVDSLEIDLTVVSTLGGVISLSGSLGFTPAAGYMAENMGFKDGGKTYRIF
jgi:hypothetical protein